MMRVRNIVILYALFSLFALSPLFGQTTYTWFGGNGDWQTTTNWSPAGSPGANDHIVINAGDVTLNADVTVATFELNNGNLLGTGKLTIGSALTWNDGRFEGSGEIHITSGATMILADNDAKELTGRTIRNDGTFIFGGNGDLRMKGGSMILNQSGAIFDLQNDALVDSASPDGGTFVNNGTIVKSAGSSISKLDVGTTNNGTIAVNIGTMRLSQSSSHSGTIDVAAGALLEFSEGYHTVNSAALNGSGIYEISSARVHASGTTTIGASATFEMTGGSGSLSGDGDIVANGIFNWDRGSIIGGGTLTINNVLNMTSSNSKTLDTKNLTNNGAINFSGSGEFRLKNGSVFTNPAGKTVNFETDADIAFATPGGGTIINSGTINKNIANGFTVFEVALTNDGIVNINSGTLKLENGSALNGSHVIAAGAKLEMESSTYTLANGSTISGGGDFALNSGDLTFSSQYSGTGRAYINGGIATFNTSLNGNGSLMMSNGDVTLNSAISVDSLTVDGGTLHINNPLTVGSLFTWSDGTITGGGAFNLNGDIQLIGNDVKLLDGQHIVNSSSMIWAGNGDIRMTNGATLLNEAGATLDIQGNALLDSIAPNGGTFTSNGTLSKSGGGLTILDIGFNGSGTINVSSGTLRFSRSSAINAAFNVQPNGILQFTNLSHHLTNPNFSGGGTVQLSSTMQLLGANFTIGNGTAFMMTESASNLEGNVNILVDGNLNWDRGNIRTTGLFTVNGSLNLSGNNNRTLEGLAIVNNGSMTWSGSGEFRLKDGCEIINQAGATFSMSGAANLAFIDPSGGVVTNHGTIIRDGAGSMTWETHLTNDGTVTLNNGTLRLEAGSTHSGAVIDGQAGGVLELDDGVHTFDNACAYNGASEISVTGGSTDFNGTFDGNGSLSVTGGSTTLNGSAAFQNLTLQGATFTSAGGDMTIANDFHWMSGTFIGSGTCSVGNFLDMPGDGDKKLDGWALSLAGNGEWGNGGGDFKLRNNAVFTLENGGIFEITGDGGVDFDSPDGGTITNHGTFIRHSDTTETRVSVEITNTGDIHVQHGTLKLTRNSSHQNSFFQIDSGATFLLNSGDHTLDQPAGIDGGGTLFMDDASLTVTGPLSIDGDVTLLMTESNSLLQSNDPITINGNLAWERGVITGSGAFTVNGGLFVSGNNHRTLDGRNLDFHGVGSWDGSGDFQLKNSAVFTVHTGAIWDILDNAELEFTAPDGGTLVNFGTIIKSGGNGATAIKVPYQNSGTLNVASGTVRMTNSFTTDSTSVIAGTDTLDVSSITFENKGLVSPGTSPGVLTIDGAYTQAADAGLHIELGGNTPGDGYDRLHVKGNATIDGEVTVSLANNFSPAVGDSFFVLTSNNLFGQFSSINDLTGSHVSFDYAYTADAFKITVTAFTNQEPGGTDDNETINEDETGIFDVLANDSDPDNDPLTISEAFGATNGTLTILGDTLLQYTPVANFFGQDNFQYVLIDGFGGSDTAAVQVTILSVNDAPIISGLPDSLRFEGDSSVVIHLWDFVEDVETPDDQLTYEFTASNGSLLHAYSAANGNLTISAASGFSGMANLTVKVSDADNDFDEATIAVTVDPVVSVEPVTEAPIAHQFELAQNYPNPFNPNTTIRFQLPESGDASLVIYNMLGQKVRTLLNGPVSAGNHEYIWDAHSDNGEQLGSGIYFYQLVSGKQRQIRKMILLK